MRIRLPEFAFFFLQFHLSVHHLMRELRRRRTIENHRSKIENQKWPCGRYWDPCPPLAENQRLLFGSRANHQFTIGPAKKRRFRFVNPANERNPKAGDAKSAQFSGGRYWDSSPPPAENQ